jgi:trk system potassium uptake protein TrkH
MFDLRPVVYVIGLITAVMGASMLVPMCVDLWFGSDHWLVFLLSFVMTSGLGGLAAIASANGVGLRLGLQQTFLLTTGVWVVLPVFGAIPFMLGVPFAGFTDAFFEAMSGLTTTGSTVFSGLDDMPKGILLWRGMLQWFGGVGIIVVAMVFLPELRVGGMQIFRSEAFDTMGKILPRATQIAGQISVIYVGLTLACIVTYSALGMGAFDAVVHAMTTVSTGGFANYDSSFTHLPEPAEYAASVFMILAALPFVRFVQMINGQAMPLLRDPQVRGFFWVIALLVGVLFLWTDWIVGLGTEQSLRESLFNATSILSGTGYASADYMLWGPFAVVIFFLAGLIGGCAGSTACSIKIFRYQLLFSAIRTQIRRLQNPNGLFQPRYAGHTVGEDVISSVMAFFVLFFVSLGVVAILLGMTGLDFITSLSGAASALANIGPGLGDQIGPSGNFAGLNPTAKWILIAAMLIGRLEIMAVYVLFTIRFWRA